MNGTCLTPSTTGWSGFYLNTPFTWPSVLLVLRRVRVRAIAVRVADAPVPAVDHDLRPFAASGRPRGVDGLRLRRMDGPGAGVALALHRPPVIVRHNMLILAHTHLINGG